MKMRNLILCLLCMMVLLTGCRAEPETVETTVAAMEEVQTEPAETMETEPETTEESRMLYHPVVSEPILPETDAATGTLQFYIGSKTIHAGMPVSELLSMPYSTYDDLQKNVQPWNMTGTIRLRIDIPEEEKNDPFIFFVGVNASDEPCTVADCLIYSISVTMEKNIRFGSGKESTPFEAGVTTRDEIVAAYGEPNEIACNSGLYEEIFYYEPFNSVSFSFRNGVVRQINTYYSLNLFGGLLDQMEKVPKAGVMRNDGYILMNQYLDVFPYLDPEKGYSREDVGILKIFDRFCHIGGMEVKFGSKVSELPTEFRMELEGITMPLDRHFYVRTGRGEAEEFFVINHKGQKKMMSDDLVVKGVVTENPKYTNWGFDTSEFHEFDCMGVTPDTTIQEILEMFGEPAELFCSSTERTNFAWMHYHTARGDYLHIRVDPVLNQVAEVQMVKHFDKERHY